MKLLSIIVLASGAIALPQFKPWRGTPVTPIPTGESPTPTPPCSFPTGFPTPTAPILFPTAALSTGTGTATAGFPAPEPTETFNFPSLKNPVWW
ncbi:hypothetical protein EMPG_11971 [Blastomyces silverae]|uniref:Uncharacterized protein n=1 Tax=Blastomyces silverae TaxID=2060906 RepID=A0A0H1BPW3_9EURO|nr:hypothetical protein EMPG_11971 [Blastomyces silverae]